MEYPSSNLRLRRVNWGLTAPNIADCDERLILGYIVLKHEIAQLHVIDLDYRDITIDTKIKRPRKLCYNLRKKGYINLRNDSERTVRVTINYPSHLR